MIHDTESAQISPKQVGRNIYGIIKTMCKPYNVTSCTQVHDLPQRHCGDNQEGTLFS